MIPAPVKSLDHVAATADTKTLIAFSSWANYSITGLNQSVPMYAGSVDGLFKVAQNADAPGVKVGVILEHPLPVVRGGAVVRRHHRDRATSQNSMQLWRGAPAGSGQRFMVWIR